jgi:hypothetical protein
VVPYNVSLFIVLLFTSWVSKILDLSEYWTLNCSVFGKVQYFAYIGCK